MDAELTELTGSVGHIGGISVGELGCPREGPSVAIYPCQVMNRGPEELQEI